MKTPYEIFLEQEVKNLQRQLGEIALGDRSLDFWGRRHLALSAEVSPMEAQLRRENEYLRWQVDHLRGGDPTPPVVGFEPTTMTIASIGPTLQLACYGGYEKQDIGYHIWARERATREQFHTGYYISEPDLLQARDCSALMQSALERASYELADAFHKEKK